MKISKKKQTEIQKDFNALCKKHKVNLVPVLKVTPNGIMPTLDIMLLSKKK